MVITTTECGHLSHPEFVIEASTSKVPDSYLSDIAKTIESMVAKGSVFKPGHTFQVGWMLMQVNARDDGTLTLFEPDMTSFPIKWVPGVTETLRQMMLQLFTLDSVGLRSEMNSPSIVQSAIVCARYTSASFFMSRSKQDAPADSGWFIGCVDKSHNHNDPKNLTRTSLYDVLIHQRGIQHFVSLPVEAFIVSDKQKGLEIFKGRQKLAIEPGSFLDRAMKR